MPVGPVNVPEEMSDDPQVIADNMMWDVDHTATGPQRVMGPAVNMDATPTSVSGPSPALGEHSREVLAEARLSEDEISAMLKDGVLLQYGDD